MNVQPDTRKPEPRIFLSFLLRKSKQMIGGSECSKRCKFGSCDCFFHGDNLEMKVDPKMKSQPVWNVCFPMPKGMCPYAAKGAKPSSADGIIRGTTDIPST